MLLLSQDENKSPDDKNQKHPTDLEPVFSSEVVQWEKWNNPLLNENNAGVESSPPPARNPLLSGQISLQHKARKAFPCAICFSEKQAMSYICNKLSSVCHTGQNLVLKIINTKNQKKCLQVYIVQCCICITLSQSTDLDCDISCVLTKCLFFFFFKKTKQI